MALTAKSMPYKSGFGPFASEIYRAPLSYPFRDGLSGADAAKKRDLDHREAGRRRQPRRRSSSSRSRARAASSSPPTASCRALVDWCRANDVVFIADEIQTGFARTGAMFASELFGIVPDLITTAKGIAGGLPLGGRHGPGRDHGCLARRRSRRHLRRQPDRVRRRARRDRRLRERRPHRAGQRDRRASSPSG